MKKGRLLFAAMLASVTSASFAQSTANVEIIHNSPDPNAATVDVYAMGVGLIADDLNYRSSNGVIAVPAGVQVNIGFAPSNSTSESDVLFTVDNQGPFMAGENYIVIANGFTPLTTSGYSNIPPFSLDVYVGSQTAATGGAGTNDVLVFHGSTDAPTVDVDELLFVGGEAVSNLSYGDFQGYLPLGVEDYLLQIQADANGAAVAAFSAPLATLGVDGAALTVLASGFLDPAANSNGPAFGLFVSTGQAGPLLALPSPTARVEVIHNAADTLLDVVDVFINGDEAISDFAFRSTTGFIDLPAGMPLDINAAPDGAGFGGSVDLADIPFLTPDETYIAIANGTASPGYSPQQTLGLDIFAGAREAATSGASSVDVLVYHGGTDVPPVDIEELAIASAEIISDLSYGNFDGYLELPAADYVLQIEDGASDQSLVAFDAPLSGAAGAAVTVLASGFADTETNEGEEIGLYYSTGVAGALLPLPVSQARVEIIHNSADAAAASVDVFINGDEAIEDFAFRTTTGFIDIAAGVELDIAIAPAGAGIGSAVETFEDVLFASGETYVVVANGAFSANYNPTQPLALHVYAGAREAAAGGAGTNDILVYHGSTDAPMVDVQELAVLEAQAVNDLSYSEFQNYLALGVDDYTLQIQAAASSTPVAAFDAPLATLGVNGAAITVLASGFLDPSQSENGEGFGLWVSTGQAGPLLELPTSLARLEVIHNSADAAAAVVDVFVNGEEFIPDFAFRTTTGFVDVPAGMPLTIDVAPDGAGISGSVGPIDIPFLKSGETYIAIANGIVSGSGYNPAPAFGLDIYEGAREAAAAQGANETDVLVYHGSTDAPTVDVSETGLGAGLIVDDISYGDFTANYLELATQNYQLTIQDETGATNVATFDAPLQTLMLEDAAITVLASGFLDPTQNSDGAGFGLWVSLGTQGALVPLTNVTGIEDVAAIENAVMFPNPTNDNATMFFDLVDDTNINLEVVNTMGQTVVVKSYGQLLSGNHRVEIPASELAPGFYFVNLRTDAGVVSSKLQVVQ